MTVIAGLCGVLLIVAVLWEGFETIVLPRRVARRLRFTRFFYRHTWRLWSRIGRAISSGSRLETIFAFYGPLSLLLLVCIWATALVFGFALVHWSIGSELQEWDAPADFLTDLYMSGTTFFTLGLGDVRPLATGSRLLTVVESGMGFGFLALVVAYLPAINQSFSRRETNISMLDARAGSPPTAALMLKRYGQDGAAGELHSELSRWEEWTAQLLESHLSYPVLAYYRSQHDHQSWLAALTAILDTCSVILANPETAYTKQAELTFAMARHAAVDLAAVFHQPPIFSMGERLNTEQYQALTAIVVSMNIESPSPVEARKTLDKLREAYEPYIFSLADYFCLSVPPWVPAGRSVADWQTSVWEPGPVFTDARKDKWDTIHAR